MAGLEKKIFANLLGTGGSIALRVMCVPLFIKLMGVEAFGLIGIFVTLQTVSAFLDIGIGATLNRELARFSARDAAAREQREVVFTLQSVYWLIALATGIMIFLLAPLIAQHWVKLESLSVATATTCIRLMGMALVLQFPYALYQSGLFGLHRLVLLNSITVGLSALRGPGILLVLWWGSRSPETFFACEVAANALGTAAVAFFLWRSLPQSEQRSAFRPEVIKAVWRFSAGYATNSIANLGLLQGDKIILSTVLPLKMFGYYTLAQGIIGGLYAIIIGFDGAIFPQFSALVAQGGGRQLAHAYHRACQVMAVLVVPIAILIAVFSRQVLKLWTGDPTIVENTHLILSLLVIGMMLHGLIQAPFYLQIAYGWWRLILSTNAIMLVTILPLYGLMAKAYGGAGAAAVWVLLNVCYLLTVSIMHQRFLQGEYYRWFAEDLLLPLISVLAIAGLAYWIIPTELSRVGLFWYLSLVGLFALAASIAMAPQLRGSLLKLAHRPSRLASPEITEA